MRIRGLSKKGDAYHRNFEDLTIAVAVQRAAFSNSYYINLGYIVHDMDADRTAVHYVDGDVRTRLSYALNGVQKSQFELDTFQDDLGEVLRCDLEIYIDSITRVMDLLPLLAREPGLIHATSQAAKRHLGLLN